ncbi:MAG TPA: hypothetical protein VEK12_01705 [Alphaproteobacteria bacterium]|nr:hypothetical protein [Alphaproteobacteria bacterium]
MWRIALSVGVAVIMLAKAEAQPPQSRPQADWVADQNGCLVKGNPQRDVSVTWSGPCEHGVAEGRGVLQWYRKGKATERYQGRLEQGVPVGEGVYVWANGNRYSGAFLGGVPNGHGTIRFADGELYSGRWINGCLHVGSSRPVDFVPHPLCP